MTPNLNIQPDIKVSIKQSFGIDSEMEVSAFSEKSEYVPEIDKSYKFDRDTTLAIISGFAFNKRVLVQGYHGTGKSTHIEQIAAATQRQCSYGQDHKNGARPLVRPRNCPHVWCKSPQSHRGT